MNIHTVVNQFPDHEVTLRRGLVRICDGNHCAALLLDHLYEKAVIFEGEIFEASTLEFKEVLSNLFDTDSIEKSFMELHVRRFIRTFTSEEHGDIYEEKGFKSYNVKVDRDAVDYALNALRGIYPERGPEQSIVYEQVKRSQTPKPTTDQVEARRVSFHLKRAEKLALPASLSLEVWLATLEYFERRCAYCDDGTYQVFEHYIPLAHGGGTTAYNCVPACFSCNMRKADTHPSTFEAKFPQEAIERIKQYFAEARESEVEA